MGRPVIHFEITGTDPERLQQYFGELFGWEYDTSNPVSDSISEHGRYGFVPRYTAEDGTGVPGGVGGGPSYPGHVIFYVGVPDVEQALAKAEELGGTRVLGPVRSPGTDLVIGHFHDPDGHLVGVASVLDG
jgi:predicted enzyme related to lactoylglutathione lyase